MRRLITVLSALIIISPTVWATYPCAPIARACKDAGYYVGGNTIGKGLVDNCVRPILKKQKYLPGISFDEDTLLQCEKQLQEIMKQHH